jgi:peptidoglycan/xylan/chitin deacetylase (PgdA/CDA1 family)
MAVTANRSQPPDPPAGHGAILMYHRVVPSGAANPLAVRLECFEQHLRVMTAGDYRVLPLDTLAARAASHDLPPRTVAVTFDDGYANHLSEIVAALVRFAVPATFFVVGRALEPGYRFWWDSVDAVFAAGRRLPASIPLTTRPGALELPTATDAERREARMVFTRLCYDASLEERDRLMAHLLSWGGGGSIPEGPRPVTVAELCELAAVPGLTIGAHTENHLWLPKQPAVVQQRELAASRERLERILDAPVTSLAYPYGAHDPMTIEVARRTGYTVAVTTVARPVTDGAQALELPRYDVGNDDGDTFGRFLSCVTG